MQQILQYKFFDGVVLLGLIALWLLGFKSASLFNFFGTYSSLWYLPAGITLAIAIVVPLRFVISSLLANWLLAVPIVSSILQVEYTSVQDHLFHGTRLFVIYAGAGLILRYGFRISFPVANLSDQLTVIVVTLFASIVGAASGVSLHVAMGSFDWGVAQDIWLPWMIGDGIAAVIVPPLLVPLLMLLFGTNQTQKEYFPTLKKLLLQFASVIVAMFIAFKLPADYQSLGPLWYVIVLPAIIAAVKGGIPTAATSIAITALMVPPLATYLGYDGERVSLQFLLLIGASVSLMIGGAISDRDRAFQLVKSHEEELENTVAQRTLELRQANNLKDHLLRSIGHDLRQPIFAMNNLFASLAYKNKDPKLARTIEKAEQLGETTSKFVSTILDYSKREAGKVEVHHEEFPIQRVFDQVIPMFEEEAKSNGVKLNIQPTNLILKSDETLLWEALSNILQNAVRLSFEGQEVRVFAQQFEDGISIIVTDQIKPSIDIPGEAGFGLDIIKQISKLLNFQFTLEPNEAKITFKQSVK